MRRTLRYLYIPLAALYLAMALAHPVDPLTMQHYHLNLLQARLLSLSVAVPFVAIWFIAYYAAYAFREYSQRVRRHADGKAFVLLAPGLEILAWYLPVRALTKPLLNWIAILHPALAPFTTATATYINLLVPLAGFLLVSRAARELRCLANVALSLRSLYSLGLVFGSLSVLYSYASFTTMGPATTLHWFITTQAYIPMFIRVPTIMIPNLFLWLVGLQAAWELYLYQRHVAGILYRQALRWLSTGLGMVIIAGMLLQFATALAPQLARLPLSAILVITYSMMLLGGTAYTAIAWGVRQLRRIEEL